MSKRVVVTRIPNCDLCGDGTPAKYDSRMMNRTAWANMCQAHWDSNGIGRLGTGFGQEYILKASNDE
jgi:hypothetical protein